MVGRIWITVRRLMVVLLFIASAVGARAVVFPTTSMPGTVREIHAASHERTSRTHASGGNPLFQLGLRVVSFGDVRTGRFRF